MKIAVRHSLFAGFSAILMLMLAGPIWRVIQFALDTENTYASQIVLIPFISAVLIYINRHNIFGKARFSLIAGSVFIAFGITLEVVGRRWGANLVEGDQLSLMMSSLVVLWLAGFLFFYGPAAFRAALFPLLFLVICIPIPSVVLNRTIEFLQYRSAEMSFFLLKTSGTPVYREGVILTLPDLVIEVAPQCSGIRSSISILILSLLVGYLLLKSWWRRCVLLAAAIPIVVVKNALRIYALSWLAANYDKRILTSELHREGGIPFFLLALLLVYPILLMLVRSESKRPEPTSGSVPLFSSITGEVKP